MTCVTADSPDPVYTDTLELDLSTVEASVAGPARPQDRINLKDVKIAFQKTLTAPVGPKGFELKVILFTLAVSINCL